MGRPWRPTPTYRGRAVAIIGGGSSLSLAQVRLLGMARAKDLIRVIAINDAVYPCWFADIAYACDKAWWAYHAPLAGFPGRRVSLDDSGIDGVDYLVKTGTTGLELDPRGLRSGGNSGYQAINLAVHLGADRVILVGYDMRGSHWFGEHPEPIRRVRPPDFKTRISDFVVLASALAAHGVTALNATPGSAVPAFRFVDLETELNQLEVRMDKKKPGAVAKPANAKPDAKSAKTPPYGNRQMNAGSDYKTR